MMDLVKALLEKKIITIVRGTYGEALKNLAKALYKGGIRFIEVTFDQMDPDCLKKTAEAIELLNELSSSGALSAGDEPSLGDEPNFGDELSSGGVLSAGGVSSEALFVGAGTVLNPEQVKVAYDAGAKYIVSPNTNAKVIGLTKQLGMISIPGAMTPTEILYAHDLGADFVKLFPTASLGFDYVKDLLSPISHVPILATAGITEENFAAYLKLGIKAAGISGRLTDKTLLATGDWAEFTRRAQKFVEIAESPLKKL